MKLFKFPCKCLDVTLGADSDNEGQTSDQPYKAGMDVMDWETRSQEHLCVKGGQRDGKGLGCGDDAGIEVHDVGVGVDLAKLHYDGLGGVGVEDELEVLDRGQLHAPPEVEAPAAQVVVPMRRLVAQLHALPSLPLLQPILPSLCAACS